MSTPAENRSQAVARSPRAPRPPVDSEKRRNRKLWSLARRGRPEIRGFAFKHLVDMRNPGPGRPSVILEITEAQMRRIEELIGSGATPHEATDVVVKMPIATLYRIMDEGLEADPNTPKGSFAARIAQAVSMSTMNASRDVYRSNKEFWLSRSPNARTRADRPGWTEEKTVRHGDPLDGQPMTVRLLITTQGAKTQLGPAIPAQLVDETE